MLRQDVRSGASLHLEIFAEGLSNSDIAEKLFVAEKRPWRSTLTPFSRSSTYPIRTATPAACRPYCIYYGMGDTFGLA